MNMKVIARSVAIMILFGVVGLTRFTENVRIVQVIGLFASGAVIGASLSTIIAALKANKKAEEKSL